MITDASTIPDSTDEGIEVYVNNLEYIELLETEELWFKSMTPNETTIVIEKDTTTTSTSFQELLDRVTSLEALVNSLNLQASQQGARISYLESIASTLPTSIESIRFIDTDISTTEELVSFTRDINFYGFKEDTTKLVVDEVADTLNFKTAIKYGFSPYIVVRTTNNNPVNITTTVKNSTGGILSTSTFTVPGKSPSQIYSEFAGSKLSTIDNTLVDNTCQIYVSASSTGLSVVDGAITFNS